MNSNRDLEIYKLAFELAVKVHKTSLKLPQFELFEQGSQIRRSSKSVKDQIAEGFGRRRYKAEYVKFLIYSHSSCDEATSQLEMLNVLYPEMKEFSNLLDEYAILGRKINSYIEYVERLISERALEGFRRIPYWPAPTWGRVFRTFRLHLE